MSAHLRDGGNSLRAEGTPRRVIYICSRALTSPRTVREILDLSGAQGAECPLPLWGARACVGQTCAYMWRRELPGALREESGGGVVERSFPQQQIHRFRAAWHTAWLAQCLVPPYKCLVYSIRRNSCCRLATRSGTTRRMVEDPYTSDYGFTSSPPPPPHTYTHTQFNERNSKYVPAFGNLKGCDKTFEIDNSFVDSGHNGNYAATNFLAHEKARGVPGTKREKRESRRAEGRGR